MMCQILGPACSYGYTRSDLSGRLSASPACSWVILKISGLDQERLLWWVLCVACQSSAASSGRHLSLQPSNAHAGC